MRFGGHGIRGLRVVNAVYHRPSNAICEVVKPVVPFGEEGADVEADVSAGVQMQDIYTDLPLPSQHADMSKFFSCLHKCTS